MKLQRFEVESYMTLHENNCRYNLADTVAKSLTLKELLAYDKKDSLEDLMNLSLDYGAIEGSHELKKGILSLYQSGDDEEIAICHGGVNANELVLMTLLSTNDHILSFLPTYQQLYSFPESLGVEVDFIHLKEENEWKIDFEELEKNIRENTKMICLNLPNNPTGTTLTKEQLKEWVDYAHENDALILFDAAYESFIKTPGIPHSIFEIEGAKDVAVEFRSYSKVAGFTGTRCAYCVVPEEVYVKDANGNKVQLNPLWNRRQSTKFNGVSYPVQRAAQAIYTPEGKKEIQENLDYYVKNAQVIRESLEKMGLKVYGGVDSQYIWFKTPYDIDYWIFFDILLKEAHVVSTPGAGFGPSGEGYLRLTAFNTYENTVEAMDRISKLEF